MNEPGTLTVAKVTPIDAKKPAPVATHTISYVLDGFPVTTQLETTADIRAVVDRLKAIGATPPVGNSKPANAAGTPDDAPICEFHGAMKPSKFGGFFCPKKMGDGSHCKSKA